MSLIYSALRRFGHSANSKVARMARIRGPANEGNNAISKSRDPERQYFKDTISESWAKATGNVAFRDKALEAHGMTIFTLQIKPQHLYEAEDAACFADSEVNADEE